MCTHNTFGHTCGTLACACSIHAHPQHNNKWNAHMHTYVQPFPGTTLAHGPHPTRRHTYTPLHAPMNPPTPTHTRVYTNTHTRTHTHTHTHTTHTHRYIISANIPRGGEVRQIRSQRIRSYFAERALQLRERPSSRRARVRGLATSIAQGRDLSADTRSLEAPLRWNRVE